MDREADEFHRDYLCEMLEKQNELLQEVGEMTAYFIGVGVIFSLPVASCLIEMRR